MSANILPHGDLCEKLQQKLENRMNSLHIPGAIFHVDVPQHQLSCTNALGWGDVEHNVKMVVENHMYTGSITKTFIAMIILQLVDQGTFRLDDSVSDNLPGPYPQTPTTPQWSWSDVQGEQKITIRQLLNHTSGLYNYTDDYESFFQPALENPHHGVGPEQTRPNCLCSPTAFRPWGDVLL